ncbi:hypothetical protein [Dokdonella soli]|uniref:Uncharacterized protein n=1 Tax=Dokdonella soli TaxID=529810 RepID=A0ABN1IJ91_9GAMM
MGVKQADIEKGLGIKSDADFAKYMAAIQKQTDSSGNNTKSIVQELKDGFMRVVAAINGQGPGTPTGHSTHGINSSNAAAIGSAIGDALNRRLNSNMPRSSRGAIA